MAPLVHSVEIDRPPEDVFADVTDPSRVTEWQDAVVSAQLQGDEQIIKPLVKSTAAKYAADKKLTARDGADCQS